MDKWHSAVVTGFVQSTWWHISWLDRPHRLSTSQKQLATWQHGTLARTKKAVASPYSRLLLRSMICLSHRSMIQIPSGLTEGLFPATVSHMTSLLTNNTFYSKLTQFSENSLVHVIIIPKRQDMWTTLWKTHEGTCSVILLGLGCCFLFYNIF